jgi:hypothetical protein
MVSIGVPLEMGTVVKMLALFPSFKTRELLLLKAMRRCQKSNAFLAPFDVKPIILPRQARDKHRETLEKGERRLFAGTARMRLAVSKQFGCEKRLFLSST